mgnify:CR=1 FL=1
MIIRSQDKKSITPLCEISIVPIRNHVQRKEYRTIGYKMVTDKNLEIGRYSTEEKAIKVLDMICAEYQYAEECKHTGVGSTPPEFVFQMPSDEEVEV